MEGPLSPRRGKTAAEWPSGWLAGITGTECGLLECRAWSTAQVYLSAAKKSGSPFEGGYLFSP